MFNNFDYEGETRALFERLDPEEHNKCFLYNECELERNFLAFIHSYKDLADILSKNTTIIDIGSNQGIQGEYFRDFKEYIAVEPYVPEQYIYKTPNTTVYNTTGEDFIEHLLPVLCEQGLELKKTFCICSYVPCPVLRDKIVPAAFPYYRTTYADVATHQNLPTV